MSAVESGTSPASSVVPLRAKRALALAVGLLGLLVGGYLLAFHDPSAARADADAYRTFTAVGRSHLGVAALAQKLLQVCQPDPYVLLAAVPVLIALARRRWTLALALAVMIPGAILTTELLKPLLAHPRPSGSAATPLGSEGSWPSGHSTAAMTLAMACVLASSARWRPYVAVAGAAFALAVIYSLLTLGWHYPSDALGGVLVASIWSLLAAASAWIADARLGPDRAVLRADLAVLRADRRGGPAHLPPLPAMVAAGMLPVTALLFVRGAGAGAYAAQNPAFVVALLGIGAAVALAPAGLSVLLSGSDPAATGAPRARWRRG